MNHHETMTDKFQSSGHEKTKKKTNFVLHVYCLQWTDVFKRAKKEHTQRNNYACDYKKKHIICKLCLVHVNVSA